jgi:CRP-like cAMP-binding protein
VSALPQIEKVLLLRGATLFHHCNAEAVVRIASIAAERRFERGEVIYTHGDAADALYFVVSGSVALDPPSPPRGTPGGDHDGTRALGPRETFGVLEILSGRPREGLARAVEPTVTLAIEADDFFDLLSHDIEIVKALFREVLAERSGNGATG